MSTCPKNDIHSIYLDGELPEGFKKDYEAHIAGCEKCRRELERLRRISAVFKTDSASVNMDKQALDQSFERLQSRMRFSRVVKASSGDKNIVRLKNFVPLAAAAAAVFAILLPLKNNATQSAGAAEPMLSIVSADAGKKAIAENDIIVEGGITSVAFNKDASRDMELKVSGFEELKSVQNGQSDEDDSGMKISVTKLSQLNSISAANVSLQKYNPSAAFVAPDFLK